MTWFVLVVALAVAGPQLGESLAASDEMTGVRELYALASYEEALVRLDTVESRVAPELAAQYRVLCLLGLGRLVEAEQAMARFVVAHPTYTMSDADVSPRLLTLFRETRLRALPAAARSRYSTAKAAFDRQNFTEAARGFQEVLTLLGDAEITSQVDGLSDLKLLTESFFDLADAEIQKAARAAAPPPDAPAIQESQPAAAPSPAVVVYTDADTTVIAPVELSRRMPIWDPPSVMAHMTFRGVLEIVIDEQGEVASATLVRSIHPYYDGSLLDATTRWRFRPATKNGSPVRFRRRFEVVLSN